METSILTAAATILVAAMYAMEKTQNSLSFAALYLTQLGFFPNTLSRALTQNGSFTPCPFTPPPKPCTLSPKHSFHECIIAAKFGVPPSLAGRQNAIFGRDKSAPPLFTTSWLQQQQHDPICRVLARRTRGHPIVLNIALSLHYLLQPSCILQ